MDRARELAEKGNIRFQTVDLDGAQDVPASFGQYASDLDAQKAAKKQLNASASAVPANDSLCDGYWWPNRMTAKAGKSSVANRRYGQLEFHWSFERMNSLRCFEDVTFEPDYVTYNYDDKHYFTSDVTAWSTTMPRGYLDTAFGDSDDERVYTVGTWDAKQLVDNTIYKTYFRTAYGNSSTDTAKVNAQRGNRTPSICHSTWCIFARQTIRIPSSGWFAIPTSYTTFVQ